MNHSPRELTPSEGSNRSHSAVLPSWPAFVRTTTIPPVDGQLGENRLASAAAGASAKASWSRASARNSALAVAGRPLRRDQVAALETTFDKRNRIASAAVICPYWASNVCSVRPRVLTTVWQQVPKNGPIWLPELARRTSLN